MTRGVEQWVSADELLIAIFRHSRGDWGNLCEEDKIANDDALKHGFRLLSSYQTLGKTEVLDYHRARPIPHHNFTAERVLVADRNYVVQVTTWFSTTVLLGCLVSARHLRTHFP